MGNYQRKIKIRMFIKSLKIILKQNTNQSAIQNEKNKPSHSTLRRHLSINPQNVSQLQKKSKIKFILQNSCLNSPSHQSRNKSKKLIQFQNQYLKTLNKQDCVIEQRRKYIKQKIKGKVKQQLADLIKRSDLNHNSLADVKIKDQLLGKSRIDVSVKGSSVQRTLKMSFSQRPQLVKLEHLRKFTHRKISLRQPSYHKPFTAGDQPLKQQRKQRRSLSNMIRALNISQKKVKRNIHSALGDIKINKKDSVEIEPWHYTDDY